MDKHTLIIQDNPELLNHLRKREIVVMKNNFHDLKHISRKVNERNFFHYFVLHEDRLMHDIPYHEEWHNLPMLIYMQQMGDFKELTQKIPLIKKLKLRFLFPAAFQESYLTVQVLSSVGIDSGLYFDGDKVHWELLTDLMHYDIYGKANHAYIQPFFFMKKHYEPARKLDFGDVYFDNPMKYLYIDNAGKIYMSKNDMDNQNPLPLALDEIYRVNELEEYQQTIHAWQEHFIMGDECAYCKSWRLCLGKFNKEATQKHCSAFFSELFDGLDAVQQRKENAIN